MELVKSTNLVLLLMCGVWCQRYGPTEEGFKSVIFTPGLVRLSSPTLGVRPPGTGFGQLGIHVDRSYVTRDV